MSIKDQGKAQSGSNHPVLLKECPGTPGLVNQVCTQDKALWFVKSNALQAFRKE